MGIKVIADNKKARFDYQILEKFEAGLVLMGSEVKSIRAGKINLKDSYVSFRNNEAFLQNAHISVYTASSYNNHDPERLRKLLLNKKEIDKIQGSVQAKSLTCVPLRMYFKNGRIKIEIGLGKGKKAHDKRDSIKKREMNREMQKSLKQYR